MTLLDKMQQTFYRDVIKHGSSCGYTDFDDWINSLTPIQLLREISYTLGEPS